MLKLDLPRFRDFRHTNLIDGVAIGAALLWLGLMLGLGYSADVPFWTAFMRGMFGAVFIYAMVFVGLQLTVRLAEKTTQENQTAVSEGEPAPQKESPQETTPGAAKGEK